MISKERRNFIAFLHERHVYDVSRKRTRVKRVAWSDQGEREEEEEEAGIKHETLYIQ